MDQQTAALLAEGWPRQIAFLIVMALIVVVPTGTVHYWQAWLFLSVFTVLTIAMGAYFVVTDPALVARVRWRPVPGLWWSVGDLRPWLLPAQLRASSDIDMSLGFIFLAVPIRVAKLVSFGNKKRMDGGRNGYRCFRSGAGGRSCSARIVYLVQIQNIRQKGTLKSGCAIDSASIRGLS